MLYLGGAHFTVDAGARDFEEAPTTDKSKKIMSLQ